MDIRKVLGFAVGPILSGALGIITLPILTWNFSAADIGRMTMLQVATTMVTVLFTLGMDQAYVREFHDAREDNRPSLLVAAIAPGLLLLIATALGIFLTAPDWISRILFEEASTSWALAAAAFICIALVSRFLSLVLRMQERGLAFSLSQSLPKLLLLLVVVLAWLLQKNDFGILLAAQIASSLVVLAAYSWKTRRDWIPGIKRKFAWAAHRQMLKFGLPLVLGGFASWFVMNLDKTFLKHFASLSELGVYSVAASLASAVGIATTLFTTIWVPTIYKWQSAGDAWPRIEAATQRVLAGVVLILSLTGLLSPLVMLVLPKHYAAVPYLIPCCMSIPLYYALSEATAVGIGLSRKSAYSMAASGLAALVGAITGFMLVPRFGAAGAGASAVVAGGAFLFARTELACLAWRPVNRGRVYFATTMVSIAAIGFAFFGQEFSTVWCALWALLLAVMLYVFRETFKSSVMIVMAWRNKQSLHSACN